MKKDFKCAPRSATSSLRSASVMPRTKSALNQASEYWYMGSTDARSEMQKKRSEARRATGR